jgi:hypothetical protein
MNLVTARPESESELPEMLLAATFDPWINSVVNEPNSHESVEPTTAIPRSEF